jgi:hypothetical protein
MIETTELTGPALLRVREPGAQTSILEDQLEPVLPVIEAQRLRGLLQKRDEQSRGPLHRPEASVLDGLQTARAVLALPERGETV